MNDNHETIGRDRATAQEVAKSRDEKANGRLSIERELYKEG